MGNESEKENKNMYFQARKSAASYDSKLYSREGASELLGVSVSTLADYELGNTKVVPVDKVNLMADLYRCPELRNWYCKNECPLGKQMPIATERKSIEKVALHMIAELDVEEISKMLKVIAAIAATGHVSDDDKAKLVEIADRMAGMQRAISEFQLIAEKLKKEGI